MSLSKNDSFTRQSFPFAPAVLQWQYENGRGDLVMRNNTSDALEAAENMCVAMQRYIVGDPDANVAGLDAETKGKLHEMFVGLTKEEGDERHDEWLQVIRGGAFS